MLPRLRIAVVLTMGATGCFYSEHINERPSADIFPEDAEVPSRGATLSYRAIMEDPDGDPVFPSWRFEACNDAGTCAAVETGTDPHFTITIPAVVANLPTTRISITLDVVDSYGAAARLTQRLDLDVVNNTPTVEVQRRGREIDGAFPPDVPIFVSALGSDGDGDVVTLRWDLFPPPSSVLADRYFVRLPDPETGGEEYELLPDVDGDWTVRVTVSDGLDEDFVDRLIRVVPDSPPCLGASDPLAVPGSVILLDEPRRLSVLVVDDDLDVYPAPPPNDPFLDATSFRWYLRGPGGGSFVQVATDVGALELDPAHYNPGDRIDVRVEIGDRVPAHTVQCAEDVPTCSIDQDGCLQRQTWSLEVR